MPKPNAPVAPARLDLLTVAEAAARLGTSDKTIWRYLKSGKLRRWSRWGRTAVSIPEIEKLARARAQERS